MFLHPLLLAVWPVTAGVVFVLDFRAGGGGRRRLLRAGVRALLASALVAALAEPLLDRRSGRDVVLVVAVDRSAAMDEPARREALAAIRPVVEDARRRGATVWLVGFAATPATPYRLPKAGWPGPAKGPWPLGPPAEGTTPVPEPPAAPEGRVASALSACLLAFGPGSTGGVLLVTTGLGPLQGAAEAAGRLASRGLSLRAVAVPAVRSPPPPAPSIERLDLPARVQGPLSLRARIRGDGSLLAEVRVDGQPVKTIPVPPAAGGEERAAGAAREVTFEGLDVPPGLHEVALVLEDERGKHAETPLALRRDLVRVDPSPRLLGVVRSPGTSPAWKAASAQGFPPEAVSPEALGAALVPDGPPVDAVLLDDASAVTLPAPVLSALADRVREGLGLFVEAGRGDGEAWGRLADTPLAPLLPLAPLPPPPPVPKPPDPTPAPPRPSPEPPKATHEPGLKVERRPEEALPIDLVLLLDRSESMEGTKLAMAIESAVRSAATLSPWDRVAVVTFADEATVDLPLTPVSEVGDLSLRLATVQAGGLTDIYGALLEATEILEAHDAPIRHVILLTDGQQTARTASFTALVRRLAAAQVTLTAVGLGYGHAEVLLKRLVQFLPGGAYRAADSPAELPTILTADTQGVADARSKEAHARMPDRTPPKTPGPRPQPAQPPEAPPPSPPADRERPRPEPPPERLLPLVSIDPHEATAGLEAGSLPAVGRPRPAKARPGASLVLARGPGKEPVLAAGRPGLGRVLVWALPPDAPGLSSWPEWGRVLAAGLRSVRAPVGSLAPGAGGHVVQASEGARFVLDAPAAGDAPEEVRLSWSDGTRTVDLGTAREGETVPLPDAPPGTVAHVEIATAPGERSAPPASYLVRDPDEAPPEPGDRRALARALGDEAVADTRPLATLGEPPSVPWPLWAFCLVIALVLLPVDAMLHRRTVTSN